MKLSEPHQFRDAKYIELDNVYTRNVVIVRACLVGPVGITDKMKVSESMAMVPGEQVWWYFSCRGATTATFNLITDGSIWYPVNRRSKRITSQLKPKKSVDLSQLSTDDRDFLRYIIQDYISKI